MRNRRREILDAALASFTARGYGATSMSDLQRSTGASTGSLYHHFPTKAHVAAELVCEALEDFQRGFLAALRDAPDAEAGIRAGVRHHVMWVAAHPERARLLAGGTEPDVVAIARERLRAANAAFLPAVRRWYVAAAARGELRPLEAEVAYALWMGPAQELARAHFAGRLRRPPARAADDLAEGAWSALRAAR